MPLITKPNYNQVFASQAPSEDLPAEFNNYPQGWNEARSNNGKPTIKQFNFLQQTSDLKALWILQNGACLPYDPSVEYAVGSLVLRDGVIQKTTASGTEPFFSESPYFLKYFTTGTSYPVNSQIMLSNGDLVKNTSGSSITSDPNVDINGWSRTQGRNVRLSNFNARPNTDCTAMFQAAALSAVQLKANLIIDVDNVLLNVPGAKSSLTSAITFDATYNGLTIIGENFPTIKAQGSNDDFFSMIKLLNSKNIQFHSLTFDGNGTKYFDSSDPNKFENGYSAIYTRSDSNNALENILFYNCLFKNTGESAVTSYGSGGTPLPHYFSNNINFLLCNFENIGAHGVGANEYRNSSVSNCNFKNIGMKRLVGLTGSGLAVDWSGGCEDCTAVLNNVDGSGGGFKAETHTYSSGTVDQAAKRITISNNTIKNLWQSNRYPSEDFSIFYGIRLNAIDCTAEGNDIDSYSHGIQFGGKSINSSAINNKIRRTIMANTDGIFFENSADTYGGNSASLNVISSCTRNGINLQGNRNSAISNKVSLSGVGGVHINYARNAVAKNNECFNNAGYGIRVSKKTETASVVSNDCYDTRPTGSKTQTTGIQVSTIFDEAANIQVQANNSRDNATNDYLMSDINTYSLNHYGFKEVYSGSAPLGGLWKNADRVVQSFYSVGRNRGWICSANGGASRGTIPMSSSVTIGHWWTWSTGTTVWEVTIGGTTAASAPDITGKVVGDTVIHGAATLVLRSLTTASFVSEGVF